MYILQVSCSTHRVAVAETEATPALGSADAGASMDDEVTKEALKGFLRAVCKTAESKDQGTRNLGSRQRARLGGGAEEGYRDEVDWQRSHLFLEIERLVCT